MVGNLPLTRIVSVAVAVIIVALLDPPVGTFAQSIATVPKFVSGSANITLTDDSFTGRTSVIALTSPGEVYELALIQDGFGTDTKYQYCWAEVHDTATGSGLTWRAPCNPIRVDECSLVLTSDGDFRLEVASDGVPAVILLSATGGEGVVDIRLTDQGDLHLVNADDATVWQSSENIQRQRKCKEAFNQPSASHRTRLAWFAVAFSIALSTIVTLFS